MIEGTKDIAVTLLFRTTLHKIHSRFEISTATNERKLFSMREASMRSLGRWINLTSSLQAGVEEGTRILRTADVYVRTVDHKAKFVLVYFLYLRSL